MYLFVRGGRAVYDSEDMRIGVRTGEVLRVADQAHERDFKLFTVTQTVDRGCAGGVETKGETRYRPRRWFETREIPWRATKGVRRGGVRRARRGDGDGRRRRRRRRRDDDRRSMGTTTTRCNNTTRANTRPDRPRRRRCTRDEHILMRDEGDIRGNAPTHPRAQNATRVDPNSSDDEGWRCARERSVRASRERARASVHVGGGGGNRTLGGGDYLWKA